MRPTKSQLEDDGPSVVACFEVGDFLLGRTRPQLFLGSTPLYATNLGPAKTWRLLRGFALAIGITRMLEIGDNSRYTHDGFEFTQGQRHPSEP